MLSKAFVKLTRKNKVLKVVHEVYLRKDIFCGSELCSECYSAKTLKASLSDGHTLAQRLAAPKKGGSKIIDYLVIDTNIVLHQMDLLNKPQLKNIVVLQTVLSEVQNQSQQLYNELRELCNDEERQFYVFSNEFREETHIEREPGESPNDRNDRAIRVAASWYQKHLQGKPCRVLLITNDRKNCEKAKSEGITSMTIYEYIRQIGDAELLDTLSQASEYDDSELKSNLDSSSKDQNPIYKKHFTDHEVSEAMKQNSQNKRFFQGILRQNADNWLEALIPINTPIVKDSIEYDEILIHGRIDMNRAIDGDIVLVELFDEQKWKSKSNIFVDVDAPEEDILAFEANDAKGKSNEKEVEGQKSNLVPTGHVVAILKKNWRPYVGTLELPNQSLHHSLLTQNSDMKQAHLLIFVPLDRRIPKIKVMTRQYEVLKNQRVVVSIDGWESYSLLPHGHYVKTLGTIGDKVVEAQALLMQHDLDMKPFSKQVMAELPPHDSPIVWDSSRLDLRGELVCSIDPPGCTDIDDALHCKLLENGNYQLGVHIADVSHYVKEGSHMDREARKRGNTIYLVDRRIDMLPRELGEDLCSINSNVDRYAFSVLWEVTPPRIENLGPEYKLDDNGDDGLGVKVVDVSFHKTIIRSRDNLTYAAAQMKIDDKNDNTPLTQNLRVLNSVAKILKRRRIENGALTLASPQVKFVKDESSQDPVDLEMYETKETNSLVEEFMLLANVAVAQQITKFFPAFAMLRRHPPPNQTKFDALAVSMNRFGVKLDTTSSKRLSESLEENVSRIGQQSGNADPFFNTLLRIMVTRCMNTARYFSSGTLVPSQFHHYGLAMPIYTHFTSPIRRYADVVVHRLLAASINYSGLSGMLSAKDVQRTADIINRRHRMAEYAGRDSVRYHTLQYFRGKVMPTQLAYVMNLAANGFDVLVPRYGVEGKVYLGGKGALGSASDWTFIAHQQRLLNTKTQASISMFDQVEVELSVDDQKPHTLKLAFRCVKPAIHVSFAVSPVTDHAIVITNSETEPVQSSPLTQKASKKRKSEGNDKSQDAPPNKKKKTN